MKKSLLFILAIAAAAACKSGGNEVEILTEVQPITLKDSSCTIEYLYPATMVGRQDVAIYPQVSGRITKINVIEGQVVKKGDCLFEIDNIPYQAAYDAALAQVEVSKAELETAKLTYQSKQNLFNKKIISEYQLKLAANNVKTAEAVLGQAKAALKVKSNDLSFTKVRTMGNGRIGALPFKVGSLVGPDMQKPLTVVSDNSSVYADFSIPENAYLEMCKEDSVNDLKKIPLYMNTNLGQRYEHEGRVHSISGLISQETGSIQVRALFPNPKNTLLSGGSCKVVFKFTKDDVIVVPRAAMKEIQNKLFIFVIKNGVLEQTAVEAIRLNSSQWALIADANGKLPVKAGDKITSTTNRLNDGQKVKVTE